MKALGKWIICAKVAKEKSDSGNLFLPADAAGDYIVESIGDDVTLNLADGDAVIFQAKNAIGHQKLVLVHEDDMILVL